ncbi:ankyrin repeat and LEM domain-containing protein 1 [Erpetoichthys calabaricus]|uniref:ankyrin repeat and LEM domain-containing protein 1 n=1 Tax=Erpetoichthys calabaricus TaxID=27687 RepID=UPI0022349C38|nr:ankyrin repeat and LEM domain-containing protein 1 [Erpetoichthys calabaricus]
MNLNPKHLALRLCKAVDAGEPREVERLLSQGADPCLVLKRGVAAMHLAAGKETEKRIRCLKLLLQHGGDPNIRSAEQLTPLHVAALWGCYQNLKLLLQNGADPTLLDQDGQGAAELASQQGNVRCASLLQEYLCYSNFESEKEEQPMFQYSFYQSHGRDSIFLPDLSRCNLSEEDIRGMTVLSGPLSSTRRSLEDLPPLNLSSISTTSSQPILEDRSAFPEKQRNSKKDLGHPQTCGLSSAGCCLTGRQMENVLCNIPENTALSDSLSKSKFAQHSADATDVINNLPEKVKKTNSDVSMTRRKSVSFKFNDEYLSPPKHLHVPCEENHLCLADTTTEDFAKYSEFFNFERLATVSNTQGIDATSPDHVFIYCRDENGCDPNLDKTIAGNFLVGDKEEENMGHEEVLLENKPQPTREAALGSAVSSSSSGSRSSQYSSCESESYQTAVETSVCYGTPSAEHGKCLFSPLTPRVQKYRCASNGCMAFQSPATHMRADQCIAEGNTHCMHPAISLSQSKVETSTTSASSSGLSQGTVCCTPETIPVTTRCSPVSDEPDLSDLLSNLLLSTKGPQQKYSHLEDNVCSDVNTTSEDDLCSKDISLKSVSRKLIKESPHVPTSQDTYFEEVEAGDDSSKPLTPSSFITGRTKARQSQCSLRYSSTDTSACSSLFDETLPMPVRLHRRNLRGTPVQDNEIGNKKWRRSKSLNEMDLCNQSFNAGITCCQSNPGIVKGFINSQASTIIVDRGVGDSQASTVLVDRGISDSQASTVLVDRYVSDSQASTVLVDRGISDSQASTVLVDRYVSDSQASTVLVDRGISDSQASTVLVDRGINDSQASTVLVDQGINDSQASTVLVGRGICDSQISTVLVNRGISDMKGITMVIDQGARDNQSSTVSFDHGVHDSQASTTLTGQGDARYQDNSISALQVNYSTQGITANGHGSVKYQINKQECQVKEIKIDDDFCIYQKVSSNSAQDSDSADSSAKVSLVGAETTGHFSNENNFLTSDLSSSSDALNCIPKQCFMANGMFQNLKDTNHTSLWFTEDDESTQNEDNIGKESMPHPVKLSNFPLVSSKHLPRYSTSRVSGCPPLQDKPTCDLSFSPGGRPVVVGMAEPVEFLYTDTEEGHTLIESHVPPTTSNSSRSEDSQNEETVLCDWKSFQKSPEKGKENNSEATLGRLTNIQLRRKLQELGENPGPVNRSTRSLYLQQLSRLLKDQQHHDKKGPQTSSVYSPELVACLESFTLPNCYADEMELCQQFDRPDQNRKWREGVIKSSFNYLLLDPRVTKNLPSYGQTINTGVCFQTFISAIFYVGKGKRTRPYSHLYEALEYYRGEKMAKKLCSKVEHILQIWAGGHGVISLHCFQNVIPVEAYTREACMVDAIGLKMLTNQKRGDYYGVVATWPMKRRRQLGVHLLYRAMQIFMAEGERQLHPADIRQ